MSRAKWKGPYLDDCLIKEIFNQDIHNFKTTSRKSTIVPAFVGRYLSIHNGKSFLKIKVTENMIGKKFGEFIPTRKKFSFKKNKK